MHTELLFLQMIIHEEFEKTQEHSLKVISKSVKPFWRRSRYKQTLTTNGRRTKAGHNSSPKGTALRREHHLDNALKELQSIVLELYDILIAESTR